MDGFTPARLLEGEQAYEFTITNDDIKRGAKEVN